MSDPKDTPEETTESTEPTQTKSGAERVRDEGEEPSQWDQ